MTTTDRNEGTPTPRLTPTDPEMLDKQRLTKYVEQQARAATDRNEGIVEERDIVEWLLARAGITGDATHRKGLRRAAQRITDLEAKLNPRPGFGHQGHTCGEQDQRITDLEGALEAKDDLLDTLTDLAVKYGATGMWAEPEHAAAYLDGLLFVALNPTGTEPEHE